MIRFVFVLFEQLPVGASVQALARQLVEEEALLRRARHDPHPVREQARRLGSTSASQAASGVRFSSAAIVGCAWHEPNVQPGAITFSYTALEPSAPQSPRVSSVASVAQAPAENAITKRDEEGVPHGRV